jgi:hypothetical protein
MSRKREIRLAAAAAFTSDASAPMVRYTGARVNATVSNTSTVAAEIPAGSTVVEIRITDAVYLRFGDSDMGAAAADTNSILVPAGEKVLVVPGATGTPEVPYKYFRAIRVGSTDVALQIAKVDTE